MVEEQKKFLKELFIFYENFIRDLAKVLSQLAKIQENFPDEYKKIKEIQIDGQKIPSLFDKLNQEDIGALMIRMSEASQFDKKLAKMYTFSYVEQKDLAKDLELFRQKLSEDIKRLSEEGVE